MCVLCVIHFTCKWEPNNPFHTCTRIEARGPFVPYLFLLCANILSISFLQADSLNRIKGVKIGRNGPSFTQLLFVDDSLLFFRKDKDSLENIMKILDWYCKLSSQKINLSKSDLYCSPNMHESDLNSLDRLLQVNLVQNPSKYLGLDFKLRGNRVAGF